MIPYLATFGDGDGAGSSAGSGASAPPAVKPPVEAGEAVGSLTALPGLTCRVGYGRIAKLEG